MQRSISMKKARITHMTCGSRLSIGPLIPRLGGYSLSSLNLVGSSTLQMRRACSNVGRSDFGRGPKPYVAADSRHSRCFRMMRMKLSGLSCLPPAFCLSSESCLSAGFGSSAVLLSSVISYSRMVFCSSAFFWLVAVFCFFAVSCLPAILTPRIVEAEESRA